MLILGKYSGRIYEENEKHMMEECGVQITNEQAEDDNCIAKHHLDDLKDCIVCCGCPMAQKGIINT